MSDLATLVLGGSIVGIGGGLRLLAYGFAGYRRAGRIADTATSRIGALAVGEVRVSGRVEPAELTLISAVQSRACVYYRARILQEEGRSRRTVLDEERAVGFRIADDSGAIRVFPSGASWDVPSGFHEADGLAGGAPSGVSLRAGPMFQPGTPDRDALVARLLTVHPADSAAGSDDGAPDEGRVLGLMTGAALGAPMGRREYEEARIEPGDIVTIVGSALPFDQLPDPDGADVADGEAMGGPLAAASDPEIAADLEAARAAGTLAADPTAAWGNAAIPGFGIGEPVRAPVLDPAAISPALADDPTASRFKRTFEIAPGDLVVAVGPDRPMLISLGAPVVAVGRDQDRFLLGLLGAVLAIASAIVLALAIDGAIPR